MRDTKSPDEENLRDNLASLPESPDTRVEITASAFSGPIPSPETLYGYDRVEPGAANRILKMAEKEQSHRHSMQKQMLTIHAKDIEDGRQEKKLGQIFGLTIGIVSILAGSLVAYSGKQIAGAVIGTGGVAGLVSVFVRGKREETKGDDSLISKSEVSPEAREKEFPIKLQQDALCELFKVLVYQGF
ncbi:MAG: DUF2335 domain-containing protein [Cyanobacteria bacterium P01_E01_bin.6]